MVAQADGGKPLYTAVTRLLACVYSPGVVVQEMRYCVREGTSLNREGVQVTHRQVSQSREGMLRVSLERGLFVRALVNRDT